MSPAGARLASPLVSLAAGAEHFFKTPGEPSAMLAVMHIVEDGRPGAPALLLIQNAAAPIALWDPAVPSLADAYRVIRADLLGSGRSNSAAGYDVPAQASRAGAALDGLGASRVTVIGHSSGGMVATALAEQRPGQVAAIVLINTGPSPDAKIPDPPVARLLNAPLAGR